VEYPRFRRKDNIKMDLAAKGGELEEFGSGRIPFRAFVNKKMKLILHRKVENFLGT
jgi:hypothetical protein